MGKEIWEKVPAGSAEYSRRLRGEKEEIKPVKKEPIKKRVIKKKKVVKKVDNKQDKRCRNCLIAGHFSRDCPEP